MRLLSSDHWTTLTDAQTWLDNPFARREARRDRKRNQPVVAFAWMTGVISVFVCLALWGLYVLHGYGYSNAWFLGGDIGTALCIVVCMFNLTFVVSVTQKHTLRMLVQEVSQNTLPSLLTLPISPFQILLESLVYPWRVAMRMEWVLLPLYTLCVGLGGISWLDILMLYVVFALSAVSIPRWTRPILGDISGATTTTKDPSGNAMKLSPAGTNQPGQVNQTNMPSFAQWLSVIFVVPLMSLMTGLVNRTGLGGMQMLRHYVPDSILPLLPISVVSWPLIAARGLVTPFDWFGIPVIPLPFVLVTFVLNRYTQIVRISELMQVGNYRDLATLPTYAGRRRMEGALRIAQVFIATGYFWRWGIWDGGLTAIVPSTLRAAPGLPGFVFVLLVVTVWARGLSRADALAGWLRSSRMAVEAAGNSRKFSFGPAGIILGVPVVTRKVTLRSSVTYICEPFVFAFLFYIVCCLLSRTVPFPPVVCQLAGRLLLIGIAGMLLRFGVSYALGMLSLFGVAILPLVIYKPQAMPLIVLSPLAGLVRASNATLFGLNTLLATAPPWWHWLPPAGIGVVLSVVAWLLSRWFRRKPTLAADVTLDPTQYGPEVFQDAITAQTNANARVEAPGAQLLLAIMQRLTDNAVTIKELRAKLRGKLQASNVQQAFFICIAVSVVLAMLLPQFAMIGGGVTQFLFHVSIGSGQQYVDWANVLSCWYLVLMFVALAAGISILPQAFAVEREKSTLGFLLSTPMSALDIVWGKALGLFVASGLGFGTIALWTLILSFALSPFLGLLNALIAWCEVMVSGLAIFGTVGMLALAVSAVFPRLATLKATGFFQVILIYFCIFVPPILGGWILGVLRSWGLEGISIWFVLLLCAAALSGVALLVAVFSIKRMRKHDISSAQTKREN